MMQGKLVHTKVSTETFLFFTPQENMGCLEIWDQISEVQGRFGNEYGRTRGGGEVTVPLPEPKMDTLGTVRLQQPGGGGVGGEGYPEGRGRRAMFDANGLFGVGAPNLTGILLPQVPRVILFCIISRIYLRLPLQQ